LRTICCFRITGVLFACLVLVPDLSLLLYLRGLNTYVSMVYNAVHNYVPPEICGRRFVVGDLWSDGVRNLVVRERRAKPALRRGNEYAIAGVSSD
jgi:hypothetical protein